MKQKNKRNSIFFILMLALSLVLLSGCKSEPQLSETAKNVNNSVSIAKIQLGMSEKSVLDLIGDDFEKSPCIIGYEYVYSDLDLSIGINIDDMILKRITFKNPDYTVYSMSVGIKCTQGQKILLENGFVNDGESKFKFINEDVRITMMSMDNKFINGFTVELIS